MSQVDEHVAAQSLPDVVPIGIRCAVSAFNPYSYEFYGDASTILDSLDRSGMDLSERRMLMLAVENGSTAEIKLYERVEDDMWSVSTWTGPNIDDIRAAIGQMLFDNKGVFCTGEQAKGVFQNLEIVFEKNGVVPAPHSARAAFAHPIRAYTTENYGRATVTCFC